MADFVIFENPGVKSARLERENLQLRAENARLREALGDQRGEIVPTLVKPVTRLPGTTPGVEQSTQNGATKVVIGRPPQRHAQPAIPGLQQTQAQPAAAAAVQQGDRALPGVQIFGPGQVVPALANRINPPSAPVSAPLDDSEQRFSMIELGTPNQKQG